MFTHFLNDTEFNSSFSDGFYLCDMNEFGRPNAMYLMYTSGFDETKRWLEILHFVQNEYTRLYTEANYGQGYDHMFALEEMRRRWKWRRVPKSLFRILDPTAFLPPSQSSIGNAAVWIPSLMQLRQHQSTLHISTICSETRRPFLLQNNSTGRWMEAERLTLSEWDSSQSIN